MIKWKKHWIVEIEMPKRENVLQHVAIYIVCGLMLIFLAVLTSASFAGYWEMNTGNSMLENVEYRSNDPLIVFPGLAVGIALCYVVRRYLRQIPVHCFTSVLFVWITVLGCVWIFSALSAPTEDSYRVMKAAFDASNGDLSSVTIDYFRCFPFQLGYVLFSEGLMRLFCPEMNFLVLQVINVLCLAVSYWAIISAMKYFASDDARRITAVLLGCLFQPVLFCTFLYGNIPAFAFAMLAVLFHFKFLYSFKPLHGIATAMFIGIACALKLNCSIILVAMIIHTVFAGHGKMRTFFLRLGYVFLAAVMAVGIKGAAVRVYEVRSGENFGSGIPMICWAAMGLNESYIAPGWYDPAYTVVNFSNNGGDGEKTSAVAVQAVKDRISDFISDPGYAGRFFATKFTTQFNEPTYQSIWTNEVRGHYGEMNFLGRYVCGAGKDSVTGYMAALQRLVLTAAFLAAAMCIKDKNYGAMLLLLSVLGGIAYHMIFEAKSQYFETYFILLAAVGGYGLDRVFDLSDRRKKEC